MTYLHRRLAVGLMLGCLLAAGALAAGDGYEEATRLHQLGDDAAALSRLDAFLAEHPRDSRARFLKSVILTQRNRTQEAIDVLTALSEEFPELPEPHNNLAVLYASQGRYEDARQELEMAVRAYPDYAIAYQNLGDVYAALAAQAYQKALQADASSSVARAKLEQIRQLLPQEAVAAAPSAPTTTVPAAATPAQPSPAAQQAGPASTPPILPDQPVSRPAPAAGPSVSTRVLLNTVEDWAKAWSGKDVEKYLGFYAKDFRTPKAEPRGNWEAARREQLTRPRIITVEVVEPKVTVTDPNHATVTFRQNYRADAYKSSGRKTLEMVRQGDRWLIQRETITFK